MPITMTCSGCGKSFRLRDEMAGRKVRCPECEAIQVVPAPSPEEVTFELQPDSAAGQFHSAFDRDRFLLRQKLITISEKYVVWDDQQRPILFIERPAHFWRNVLGAIVTVIVFIVTFVGSAVIGAAVSRTIQPSWVGFLVIAVLMALSLFLTILLVINLSPKRHISFYTDESKQVLLLQVLQDKKFQPIVATYTVLTAEGEPLARMKKNYLFNFFRKKWDVLDVRGNSVLVAREDSLLLSLLRRCAGTDAGVSPRQFHPGRAASRQYRVDARRVQPKSHLV